MRQTFEFHVIKSQGKSIVYLPRSKAFVAVNNEIGKSLSLYEKTSSDECSTKCKKIVSDFYEKIVSKLPLATHIFSKNIDNITMMMATDCNMRCTYCYANHCTYNMKRALMDIETAKKAIDVIFRFFPDINFIRFFGGEPLLNFMTIKKICEYVGEKYNANIIYSLESNGTILNKEIINVLKRYNINLTISLDGPQKYHDAHRVYPNKKGTYKDVIKNVKILRKEGVDFGIQCTYTTVHDDISIKTLTKYITQFTPFYKISPCRSKDMKSIPIDEDKYLLAPLNVLASKEPLYHIPTVQRVATLLNDLNPEHFCEAQSRLTIFPDGSVYPCELLKNKNFYMGNITSENFPGERYHYVREKLLTLKRSILLKNCWFRYLPYPLCLGFILYPEYNIPDNIDLPEESGEFYEHLIAKVSKIRNDKTWDYFSQNIQQYLKKTRMSHATNR